MSASYELAADNHTLLNSTEESWTDNLLNIPKTVALGVGAGVSELVNIPITVGNWLGGDTERIQYNKVLQDYDNDLGKYYEDHKLGIDTIGFIAGSLVPGMAGVKVLNGGQKMLRTAIAGDAFGSNMGTALGLLAPNHTGALAEAASAIRSTGNVFALTEANTLRALATGTGQAALESAAFEVAVAATMYKSPVLDDMSISDMTWNAAIGTAVGGVLGGIFSGVATAYKVSGAGKAATRELMPYSINSVPAPNASASNKLLYRMNQLDSIPELPTTGDLVDRASRTAEATRNKLWLDIRSDFGELTGGDETVAQSLYQVARASPLKNNLTNFLDSVAAGRIGIPTAEETTLKAIARDIKKNGGIGTDEQQQLFRDHSVTYIKTYGPDAGNVSAERPLFTSITDKLKDGQTIELMKNGKGILVGGKPIAMDNNLYREFNIVNLDSKIVEARYWWAEKLPKYIDDKVDPITVHANDIPLLTKAYNDGLERLAVIPERGAIADSFKLNSKQEIYDYLLSQKLSIADRISKAAPKTISIGDFVDRFKGYFGINFNITEAPNSNYYGFFQRLKGIKGADNLTLEADAIALDKVQALTVPLSRMMRTLKYEEGHRTFQALLDAKGITSQNIETRWPLLYTEMRKIGNILRPEYYKYAHENLDKWTVTHEYFADTFYYLSRHPEKIKKYPETEQAIGHLIKPIPQEVIDAVAQRSTKITPAEIAKIVDVEDGYLSGASQRPGGEFARAKARSEYKERMQASGVRDSEILADPLMLPSHIKVVSKNTAMRDIDGNQIEGMAKVMQRARIYDENARRISTQIIGETLPAIPDKDFLIFGNETAGGVSVANGNYGTLGSKMQYVGQVANRAIRKAKEFTSETFTPTLHKLANDQDAAIEFSVLNEKLRNLPNKYYLSEDGTKLVYGKAPSQEAFGGDEKAYAKALSKYDEFLQQAKNSGFPPEITIKSGTVQQLIADHITRNGQRVANRGLIRSGEGLPDNLDGEAFYPIPRTPRDTPHFAMVVDDSITDTGHSKMIYAKDGKSLELMMQEIKTKMPELKVLTKQDSEAYFKAHGQFEFERSLNENWINNEMARRGVSSSFLPMTDPSRITTSFLEWHLARDAAGVRDAITHNYSRQFEGLRKSADEALSAETSKMGYYGALQNIENAIDNPAINLIKMALDVQKNTEYPIWSTMNRLLDQKVSAMWSKVEGIWAGPPSAEKLDSIHTSLKTAGYEGISNITPGMYEAMNGKIERGVLTSFINKANGLLATFALRLDPLNALNNVIGQNVLLGTETRAVIDSIRKANPDAAGELAALMQIKVPGKDSLIDSPAKLIANSMTRYNDKTARQYYKDHGFITSISNQYDQTMDLLAISGADSIGTLKSRLSDAMAVVHKVGDTGERLTANTFAEEFNRFVAADVMKQITDVAVKHNIMDPTTALTYINTFVNRTQGNFLASQRPLMFQGPLGQAIGLFQTYQFNLIQQMMRHVGEGNLKNATLMMGLQGTIYGANGLPGFSAINTTLIGNAPGNTNHTDLYRAIYNAAGKESGDWLMYGLGSNWLSIFSSDLKNNLYSRGDINPRNISVVPVSPADVPIVQATTKMVGNLAESFGKVQAGADVWSTFLRGIEQNGISRPLAGMAQVINGMTAQNGQVSSVSSKGNILMAHDWYSLASLTRIAGGKPLDEALTNDAMFKFNSYRANDAAKKATLGEAIKISILGGAPPDQKQIDEFSSSYVRAGGKQENFAKFMTGQYKNASASQANQLRDKLSVPYVQSLQESMGGMRLQDIANNSELGKTE